jgi:hypothetical protein
MKLLVVMFALFTVFPMFAKDYYIFAQNEIEPEQKIFYLVKNNTLFRFQLQDGLNDNVQYVKLSSVKSKENLLEFVGRKIDSEGSTIHFKVSTSMRYGKTLASWGYAEVEKNGELFMAFSTHENLMMFGELTDDLLKIHKLDIRLDKFKSLEWN